MSLRAIFLTLARTRRWPHKRENAMRQAWHIFKKDVRYLYREIALLLALAVLFGLLVRADVRFGGDASDAMELLYIAAAAFTVARLIHAEAIPGETQFWITRPYRWTSLLTAKILFVIAFVHLPALLMQTLVLLLEGFPMATFLPGLLWTQILIALAISLPCFAIAAMTAGMVPFIGVTLVLMLIGFITFESAWHPMSAPFIPEAIEWLRYSIVFVTAAIAFPPVLYLQYRARRTRFSSLLSAAIGLVGALAFVLLPWPALFTAQALISRQVFPIEVKRSMTRLVDSSVDSEGRLRLSLPLLITGVPEDVRFQIEMYDIHLQRADGRVLHLGPGRSGFHRSQESANEITLSGSLDPDRWFLEGANEQPFTLQVSLYLTLFGNKREQTIPFQTTPVNGPEGLRCFDDHFHEAACRSPFRWPRRWISAKSPVDAAKSFSHLISYSPFPATLQLNPVVEHTVNLSADTLSNRELTLQIEEPLEYLRRDIVVPNLHLGVR